MVINNSIKNLNVDSSYVSAGIVAGLVADIVSGFFILLTTVIALIPNFNVVVVQGSLFGLTTNVVAAWIIYFAIGMFVWGLLYSMTERYMPGRTQMIKGIFYGAIIWLVFLFLIMPLSGAGMFATKYGIGAVIYLFVLDMIFGISLSLTYKALTKKP